MAEKYDNNKRYEKLCKILKQSEIPMDEAIKCIKKKHKIEEFKEKEKPFININDLKFYETKAEIL